MFTLLPGLPAYTMGILARDKITEDAHKTVLTPALENFSAAWLQDTKINLACFLKWNKPAVVTSCAVMKKVTIAFSLVAPGEGSAFTLERPDETKGWISIP